MDPVPGGLPAKIHVDRAHERLERRREQGWADAAAALGLALPQKEECAEVEARGKSGEPRGADDGGAARRKHALVIGGMAPVERLGDGEADHRVPEELQPFVVPPGRIRMLVQPAAVDECLRERLAVPDRKAEALRQGVGPVHHAPSRG